MGIFDRFKSKKEQELSKRPAAAGKGPAVASAALSAASASAPAKKSTVKEKKTLSSKRKTLSAESGGILLKPIVTEKAAVLASKGQYTFLVSSEANRWQIRTAVKMLYDVQPVSVNVQRVRGKFVRFGRAIGRRRS